MFDRIVSRGERRWDSAARPTTVSPATGNTWLIIIMFGAASLVGTALAQHPVTTQDLSRYRMRFVQVEPIVKLEDRLSIEKSLAPTVPHRVLIGEHEPPSRTGTSFNPEDGTAPSSAARY